MIFVPLRDRIVVKPIDHRHLYSKTLYIPDQKHQMGEVVAVGPGEKQKNGERRPMELKVGDKVRFGDLWKYPKDSAGNLLMSWKDVCWVEEAECSN